MGDNTIRLNNNETFMEWRCGTDGSWRDSDGNLASERESSLLDSILLLNDEKDHLKGLLSLLLENIKHLEKTVNGTHDANMHYVGTGNSFRVLFPGIYENVSAIVKISNSIGGKNE